MKPVVQESVGQLSDLFGNYRAEWLREKIFDLFTQPTYFPDLAMARPCVLEGGRGTGKTTVLRTLSYEGQFALNGRTTQSVTSASYFGLYYRVDTNRVTAFFGPELSEAIWKKLFGHYMNLLLCGQLLKFLGWHEQVTGVATQLDKSACAKIATSLHLSHSNTVGELTDNLDKGRLRFEAFLNNLTPDTLPPMSLQSAPVDDLVSLICALPQFEGKHFYFLVDEYENFLDYQQIIVNTLIKHSSTHHVFKIGVKELGWRNRATLNSNEQLLSPADYVKINIGERLAGAGFKDFASKICMQRLRQKAISNGDPLPSLESFLPAITEEDEAVRLGVDKVLNEFRGSPSDIERLNALRASTSPLEAYLVVYWADTQKIPLCKVIEDRERNASQWRTRYDNYKHALLFTIRRGRSGIPKMYAGWNTFTQLASGNIRYLLELVDRTIVLHAEESGQNFEKPISPETQTKAAQNVGRKNLADLEGLSVHGARLVKLLLGLGRVFQVLAQRPEGRAPEVNQFYVPDFAAERTDDEADRAIALLNAAVMHLAIVRHAGTKLSSDTSVKDYDFAIHPIFSPFFSFSHRKKRKMKISANQLMSLVEHSSNTIRELVGKNIEIDDVALPEQLSLFEGYFKK